MKWSVSLVAGLAGLLCLSLPSTPAGACSVYCPGEVAGFAGVEVRLLAGDETARSPFWHDVAEVVADPQGTPTALVVDGRVYSLVVAEVAP